MQHPICEVRGFGRNISISGLFVRETDIDYFEPVIHVLEMKWWALKNLVECGFRRNLVSFTQGLRYTDNGDLFHCV